MPSIDPISDGLLPLPEIRTYKLGNASTRSTTFSDEELREAHSVLAELVVQCGDRFMPFFLMLDDEIKKREAAAVRLADVRDAAGSHLRRAARRKRQKNHPALRARSS